MPVIVADARCGVSRPFRLGLQRRGCSREYSSQKSLPELVGFVVLVVVGMHEAGLWAAELESVFARGPAVSTTVRRCPLCRKEGR